MQFYMSTRDMHLAISIPAFAEYVSLFLSCVSCASALAMEVWMCEVSPCNEECKLGV
jgi:hypothetical protein